MTRAHAIFLALLLCVLAAHCAVSENGQGKRSNPRLPPPPVGCLGLGIDDCRENPNCEAIPYWGESFAPCEVDGRGFADNCPFEGCRPAGADCPTSTELAKRCPSTCNYNDFGIDAQTGCRTCECRQR